jgi:hypothetical protein
VKWVMRTSHLFGMIRGESLRDRFLRLAGLSGDEQLTVGECCRRGWGPDGGGWVWRLSLFAWEEELL